MAIKKKLAAALSLLACASVMAQGTIGTVTNVQGPVTAVTGTTSTVVTRGMPITNGMRFVTPSGTSLTFQTAGGCSVTLQPGQTVTVLQSMSCEQLAQSVRPVVAQGPVVGPNPALINGLVGVGGAAVLIWGIHEATKDDDNLSPS